MALPFVAGIIVGVVGVVAYKNRESLKEKSRVFFEQAKDKSEVLKKDIEKTLSQTKKRFEKKEDKELKVATKRTTNRTKKPVVTKKVEPKKATE